MGNRSIVLASTGHARSEMAVTAIKKHPSRKREFTGVRVEIGNVVVVGVCITESKNDVLAETFVAGNARKRVKYGSS